MGLLLYFIGQLSFLPVINLLRSYHRALEAKDADEADSRGISEEMVANTFETTTLEALWSPAALDAPCAPEPAYSRPGGEQTSRRAGLLGASKEPFGERQLARVRPLWWRALMVCCAAGALGCCSVALRVPFITFTYTGAFEPFVVVPDSTGGGASGNPTQLSVNLRQICAKLQPDLVPVAHAWFYWGAAWALLVGNPCLLAVLAAALALVPDQSRKARRRLGELVEALQCWCGAENIAIASVFLSPNLELITSFVFDGSDLCTDGGPVDLRKGEECLLVKGRLEPWPIAALSAYALLTITLARLSAWELHGGVN
jgi:hypothetical protein